MSRAPASNRDVEPTVTGSGHYQFDVVRPWGTLPGNQAFGNVSSVAVDDADRVLVFQRATPTVIVFNTAGEHLDSWHLPGLVDAHGIAIGPDQRVYLLNRDGHQLVILSREGEIDFTIDRMPESVVGVPFSHPADVSVAPNGEIYVADGYGNFRVHRFASDGRHMQSWGRPGRERGAFRVPHGIWAGQDRVLVADRENGRVQIFSRDGDWLDEWDWFFRPTDLYLDADGTAYVTDLVPSLSIITNDGSLVARGRPANNIAHGIWGDSTGSLYIAEGSYRQVTKLVRQPTDSAHSPVRRSSGD